MSDADALAKIKELKLEIGRIDRTEMRGAWLNVRNFGALGTYVDDVSVAIDALLDSHDHGTIFFPCIGGARTVYRFQTAVTIPRTFDIDVESGAILWMDHASALIAPQQELHAEWFGADCQAAATGNGCSINSGSTQLTVDTASTFLVGNGIQVPGAGVAGADLFARIVAIDGLTFTLDTAASTNVSSVRCLGDDSIAIQTILDNCFSTNTTVSHVLYLVPGITQIYQPLEIKYSMRLCGRVRAWDKLIGDPEATDMLIKLGGLINLELDHLYMDGYDDACISSNGYTLIDGSIHDCWFVGKDNIASSKGIDCLLSTFEIHDCIFEALWRGIVIQPNSAYININNCLFYALDDAAIYAVGTSGSPIRDLNITNITYPVHQPSASGNAASILYCDYVENLNITNVAARNQLEPTVNYLLYGFSILNSKRVNISNVSMMNCIRSGSGTDYCGLILSGCDNVKIDGLNLRNDTGHESDYGWILTNCTNVNIYGFYIEGTNSHAIYMTGTNIGVSIRDGRITKTGVSDNSKASILLCATLMQISGLYMGSSSSYSDYALDPSSLPDPCWFVFEKCSVDAYPSGIWDVSAIPSNSVDRTVVRDLELGGGLKTFTANDATPSVALGGDFYQTNNSSSTTITMLDNGYVGQEVHILINDANTTVDFTGTNLKGNNGADWTPASGDWMVCKFNGTNWYCEVHQG